MSMLYLGITGDLHFTRNFKLSELVDTSVNPPQFHLDERSLNFVQAVQSFRDWYARPINVNSWFRTAKHNLEVGGSSNSSHLVGCGVDFNLPTDYFTFDKFRKDKFIANIKVQWTLICESYGFMPQFNIYKSYIHLGFSLSDKSSFRDYRKGDGSWIPF